MTRQEEAGGEDEGVEEGRFNVETRGKDRGRGRGDRGAW